MDIILPSEEEDSEEEWESVTETDIKTDKPLETSQELVISLDQTLDSNIDYPTKKRKSIKKEDRMLRKIIHKTHLLCLLMSRWLQNQLCKNEEFQSLGLSFISGHWYKKLSSMKKGLHSKDLCLFLEYWNQILPSNPSISWSNYSKSFISKSIATPVPCKISVLLLCAALRAIGLETRFVASLHPLPLSFAKPLMLEQSTEWTIEGPCWIELYDYKRREWICVNVIKGNIDDPYSFEPSISASPQLQLTYIVAFESTFGLKDVTQRYCSQFMSKTQSMRLTRTESGEEWWNMALWLYSSSVCTEKDKKENESLQKAIMNEKMPTTISGFVNHPLYVLERHCKKNEIIYPKENIVGYVRGEAVYPKSQLQLLKSREQWLREGKQIKAEEQPVKMAKVKRMTLQRQRLMEQSKQDEMHGIRESTEELDMNRLFGEWQTEWYQPLPVINGKIPKNSFGNVEIFHERMIPIGTTFLKGTGYGKICKTLGVEWASAVTGFEFHQGRMVPTLGGIIVLKGQESMIQEAKCQQDALQLAKQVQKRQKIVLHRWALLIRKLLQRQRLQQRYNN